jgi:two-component system cell cycle sensor histidine kinase PleC
MHGGTFTLKSKLRIGTEVIVTFPPERVMSALAPVEETSMTLQPDWYPEGSEARPRQAPIMGAGTGLT